jgi:hypothetical protein
MGLGKELTVMAVTGFGGWHQLYVVLSQYFVANASHTVQHAWYVTHVSVTSR